MAGTNGGEFVIDGFGAGPSETGRPVVVLGVGDLKSEALDDIELAFCISKGVPTGQDGILNMREPIGYCSVTEDSALDHMSIDTAFIPAGV